MHYYGDKAKYDYENNKFGFDFGDLSTQKSKNAEPMGAGPYKFVKYENKVVYFEANENYYKGAPRSSTSSSRRPLPPKSPPPCRPAPPTAAR